MANEFLRETLFAQFYVLCNCSGVEAARRAGYGGDTATLAVQASRLLRRAKVRDILAEQRRLLAMDHREAIQRMSEMARASMDDFLDEDGHLDVETARRNGKVWLVKALEEERWFDKAGQEHVVRKIRLHDAQQALTTIMKFHHLLSELLAARDLPRDEDELDRMIEVELQRVKGPRAQRFLQGTTEGT
jgi:hypothetical protein